MRVLITGATGFVAPYIARELAEKGFDVYLTAPDQCQLVLGGKTVEAYQCDLTDLSRTTAMVEDIKPEIIVHQASLSHVGQAWENRVELVKVNVNGTSHICQAAARSGRPVTFLYGSSALVYGSSEQRLDEACLPHPVTPFGASKLAAEYVVESFHSDTFQPYIVRPFNVVGPDQSRAFVCPAFAHRILQTSTGGRIEVGNLEAKRDFADVRDLARAYRLVLEKRPPERLFVLGSGEPVVIRDILERLSELSGKEIQPSVNPDLLRPTDPQHLIANPELAAKALGWKPEISFDQSLQDVWSEVSKGFE